MHILLVGPGALGSLLSSLITKGCTQTGDRLTLLDHNPERARALTDHGIEYNLGDSTTTFAVAATSDLSRLQDVDVILLCVKSYDVQSTLEFCRPLLKPASLLVFMQNGIRHLDMQQYCGEATTAFGTTTEGATLLAPGKVRHAGSGATFLGFLQKPAEHAQDLLQQLVYVLGQSGLTVSLTDGILARLWAKLFINVGINAFTATLGCKNGELLTLPGIKERMAAAVGEAVEVAKARMIPIEQEPLAQTFLVCEKTAQNVSSMLQDVRNKKRTEIDAINGAICGYGRQLDIPTPENDRLCAEIKELEATYSSPGKEKR